jgi:predicted ATPase
VIGLCGAQRVGKSTLARRFAQTQGIPFVETSTSAVFDAMGLDPKAEYPIAVRQLIQEQILTTLEAQYTQAAKTSRMFVTDRTPIDMASYMLADIQRSTLVDQQKHALAVCDYVERCIKSTAQFFSVVVLVQPGIQVIEAAGKAPGCPAFMEHFNLLLIGLLGDSRNVVPRYAIPRSMTDLEQRLFALHGAVKGTIEASAAMMEGRVIH